MIFVGTAEIVHNGSFKNKDSLIAMKIMVL